MQLINTQGASNAMCRPQAIQADGSVIVSASFRHNLTHAEFNRHWDRTASTEVEFLVCSWRGGEPVIHGFSNDVLAAWGMATACTSGTKYKDDELEICSRIEQETLAWRGPSGRVVTVDHHRAVDN